jgi:hypothetical protein
LSVVSASMMGDADILEMIAQNAGGALQKVKMMATLRIACPALKSLKASDAELLAREMFNKNDDGYTPSVLYFDHNFNPVRETKRILHVNSHIKQEAQILKRALKHEPFYSEYLEEPDPRTFCSGHGTPPRTAICPELFFNAIIQVFEKLGGWKGLSDRKVRDLVRDKEKMIKARYRTEKSRIESIIEELDVRGQHLDHKRKRWIEVAAEMMQEADGYSAEITALTIKSESKKKELKDLVRAEKQRLKFRKQAV